MMNGRKILEGDLAALQLPDVLSFIAMIRKSGKMVLQQGSLERTIHWKDGEVAFATSNSPEHSLGLFLLRNGKITQEQYEESRERMTPQTRHGKLLVQMGVISPKDLWWAVKNQVLEIIYSMFTWRDGSFVFLDEVEEISQERIILSINPSVVIMEGVRRVDEEARIREKITSLDMIFVRLPGAEPILPDFDITHEEVRLFHEIDGHRSIRDLIGSTDLTEFEVTRILFQLISARLIEPVSPEKSGRPVFLDVEDSPELLKIVSTYNDMFDRLYATLQSAVGEERAREIFTNVLQSSDTDELWSGVFFDPSGRFDENMLIANISELPFEKRKSVLDEGLNTLLSIQLFEVSQHLDAATKVQVFRFISDQKAQIEKATAEF
ncbi:MAG TPA: DUF4388 domain-containing protein [Thermoanaerobaculia bacterium]|nr:DUF4388 domain-containing protein [Thermoanaerobaculia bacterium]